MSRNARNLVGQQEVVKYSEGEGGAGGKHGGRIESEREKLPRFAVGLRALAERDSNMVDPCNIDYGNFVTQPFPANQGEKRARCASMSEKEAGANIVQ